MINIVYFSLVLIYNESLLMSTVIWQRHAAWNTKIFWGFLSELRQEKCNNADILEMT